MWLLGVLWFVPLPSDAIMTTHMTRRNMEFIKSMAAKRGRGGSCLNVFICIFRLIHRCSNALVRHIKARNGTTIIWVVNHEEELAEMKELFGENLMGVMSDRPTLLKTFISKYSP